MYAKMIAIKALVQQVEPAQKNPNRITVTMAYSQLSAVARKFAPLIIISSALLLALLLVNHRPQIDVSVAEKILPAVEAQRIRLTAETLSIKTQGLVQPHKQIALASEIVGRAEWVSPQLISGGQFSRGDALVHIDDSDYALRLKQAQANRVKNRVDLSIAEKNHRRQQNLFKQNLSSDSQLDDAFQRYKLAEALLLSAEVEEEKAQLNLARTKVTAPFSGRVRDENIDEGAYLQTGAPIATLYADNIVELRLPINNHEIRHLNWPGEMRGTLLPEYMARVDINGNYGGLKFHWQGKLTRIESEIDQETQLFYAVAEVENPDDGHSPPLIVGLFADAEIHGRRYENVATIPRAALLGERVLIIDKDRRLHYRDVKIVRTDHDTAIIGAGLEEGELLCTTPPAVIVEGMAVALRNEAE